MRLIPLIILATLATGCGTFVRCYPSGKIETLEVTFLKDVKIIKYESDGQGKVAIDGGLSNTNSQAVESVVSGAVQGVLKTVNPFK